MKTPMNEGNNKNKAGCTFSSTAAADATEVMDCGSWLDPRDSSVAVSSAADADNDGGVEFSLFPSGESCGTTWIQ